MENSSNQYYVELFSAASKEKKLDLLDRIKKDKDENLLQFLVTCLSDEHWIVRKTAAEMLKSYGDSAVAVLSGALSSYNQDVQHWSLQILGEIGQKGLPAILRAMKSTNDEIRYFACTALGNAKLPQGVTVLLRSLGDERWRVRKAASDALVKYGEAVIAPLQQVLKITEDSDISFWAIKTLGKLGSKAQKFLLDALRNGDKRTRYVIAAALGESGDKRVIRVLIESLADPDWTIRKSATMALGEIGENAVEPMIEYLRGPNEDIRDGCLRALVKGGNTGLQKLFDEVIKMEDNHRFLIRKSIAKIGSRVVEPLMRLFKIDNPEILAFAASTLGEIGNPRAVPVLITGLSHDDWNVRRSSAYALTEIGERGVDKIAEALKSQNDDVRYWVTRILESIGEPGVPYLIRALKDANREIRYFSAKALGSSFDPTVARALINSLADEVWSVRKAAAESICRLENLPIDEIIRHVASDNEDIRFWVGYIIKEIGRCHLPHIIESMRKGDAELRLFACQAAGLIEAPELIDPLILSLRDDSEWVRTYAAISLGNTGDQRAMIPLIRSFSDRNTDVHRSVKLAFNKLGSKVFQELVKCIEGDDNELRSNAAKALAELREERGINHIIMLLEDTDENVRAAAAEALGSFPGVKTRAILQDALADGSIKVRLATIKSFGTMNSEADALTLMNHSSKAKDEREARTIKRTMTEMAHESPDLFINLFTNEHNSVKSLAMEAIVGAGVDSLARLTLVAAEATDETLVFWCKKAIKQIKSPKESMFYG